MSEPEKPKLPFGPQRYQVRITPFGKPDETQYLGEHRVKDDESALIYLDEYGRPSVHVMPSDEVR